MTNNRKPWRPIAGLVLAALVASASLAYGATNNIFTVAGTGTAGFGGDGGPATSAQLWAPVWVERTSADGYLIADQGNSRVRLVSPGGTITTIAGTGTAGFSGDNGAATAAQLNAVNGLAQLPDGSILIADSGNHRVRRVSPGGTIATVAGTGSAGFGGDNGLATAAALNFPTDLAVRSDGSYLIADNDNHRIRQVAANGTITTVAGTGTPGGAGEGMLATTAQIASPAGVALTDDGGFLITEQDGHRVRRVDSSGTIVTEAGTGTPGSGGDQGPAKAATLNAPTGVATTADGGFVVSETNGQRVRRVSPGGTITTLAGTGDPGFGGDDGPATAAQLKNPIGVAVSGDGDVLIADAGNHRVRLVDAGDPPPDGPGDAPPGGDPPPGGSDGTDAPQVTAVRPAVEPRPGSAVVLTAQFSGDVRRLEWNFAGDGQPEIVSTHAGQTSLRFRPPPGRDYTVAVSPIGPGGAGKALTQSFTAPPAPKGKFIRTLGRARDKRPAVYAVGAAEALTTPPASLPPSSAVPTTVVSGSLTYQGVLSPATKLAHFSGAESTKAEQGVADLVTDQLIKRYEVPARPAPIDRAVDQLDIYGVLVPDRVTVNEDLVIVPSPGGATFVAPQINAVAGLNAKLEVAGIGLPSSGAGFVIGLNPADAANRIVAPSAQLAKTFNQNVVLSGPLKALGAALVGDIDIALRRDGATFTVNLRLPSWLRIAGDSAQARVVLRTRDGKLDVDEMRIGPIEAKIGELGVKGFQIDYKREGDEWRGKADVCLVGCFSAQVTVRNKALEFVSARVPFGTPGIPLFKGVFLEEVEFGLGLDPTRLSGGARIGVGQIVKINGRMVFAFPPPDFELTKDGVGGVAGFPDHLYRRYTGTLIGVNGEASLELPLVGSVPFANGYAVYEHPGYVAVGGGIDLNYTIVGSFRLTIQGGIAGELSTVTERFNFEGGVRGCLGGKLPLLGKAEACTGARGVVSDRGAGICASLLGLEAYGGVWWAGGWTLAFGCRLSRFRQPNVRGAAAATAQAGSPHLVRIRPGDRTRNIRLDGDGGPPLVRVTAPGGQTLESDPEELVTATDDGSIGIIHTGGEGEEANLAVVGLIDPRPGTYKIEPLEGSAAVEEITEAIDPPSARVTGKVRGAGERRVLDYDVGRRPDQRVTFVEVTADGTAAEIGSVRGGGRGRLRFRPRPGRGASRIEAQFELLEMPAERRRVARFSPPSPRLAKPRALRVRRKGKGLRVSWRKVPGAGRYELAVTGSNRPQASHATRKPRIEIKRVPKTTRGQVTVRAIDQRAGATVRAGAPAKARFRRTARPKSSIGPLPRCRGKTKISCRSKR